MQTNKERGKTKQSRDSGKNIENRTISITLEPEPDITCQV